MSDKFLDTFKVKKLHDQYIHKHIKAWWEDEFLTLGWWNLLALTILPWIIWYKVVDRKRMLEILF